MQKILGCLALRICFLLFSGLSLSNAQEVGAELQGSVPVYDVRNKNIVYDIPLPAGKWLVRDVVSRSSRGSAATPLKDVRLGLIEDGKLIHIMEITAHIGSGDVRWNDEPCKLEPVLYKNNYNTSLWKQKCLTVLPQTFLQGNSEFSQQLLKFLVDNKIHHDFNSLVSIYTRYGDFGKFLVVRLHTFPSNYGLENPVIGVLNTSPYYPNRITTDKNKQVFVDALAKYSETLAQWFDSAYDEKKFTPLPSFKHSDREGGRSDDTKNKVMLLEKALEAKLITQAEFDQKKLELLKGTSQP